jgi:DNA-binding NtrC family response regulator
MYASMAKLLPEKSQKQYRILVSGLDPRLPEIVNEATKTTGRLSHYEVSSATLSSLLGRAPSEWARFDLILIELGGAGEVCLDWLSSLKQQCPDTQVIFVASMEDMHLWIEAIQRGAYDYLPTPLDTEELNRVMLNALQEQ